MKERNRDIFERALNDLPQRKAAPGSWNGIADGLDQLDASRFVGQNKGKLPVHNAPAGTWKGIEAGLKAAFWAGTAGLMIKGGALVVLSATVLTALILFLPEKEGPRPDRNPAVVVEQGKTGGHGQAVEKGTRSPEGQEGEAGYVKGAGSVVNSIPQSRDNIAIPSGAEFFSAESPVLAAARPADSSLPRGAPETPGTGENDQDVHLMPYRDFLYRKTVPEQIAMKEADVDQVARDDYFSEKAKFDIGLGVHYAWMNYGQWDPEGMELPDIVTSMGIDVLLEWDRFYLRTGMSYASWEESGAYNFNINRNELVYSYQYVDSAYIDQSTGQVNYITTEQDVYDSVFYKRPDEIVNRYRVLQVPLEFGYKMVASRRWTFGVHAGIGADINIGSQAFTPVFTDDQATLAGVDDHMVYRPALNWRLAAGVTARYRFTRRFSLYMEPTYHTYLNTVYPGANSNNLFYLQLKFGILYKF